MIPLSAGIDASAPEIRKLHEEQGMSLQEARRIFIRRKLRAEIDGAETVEDLKKIMLQILDQI